MRDTWAGRPRCCRRGRNICISFSISNFSWHAYGQRGLAGVVFLHKIAGANAKNGACLDEVTAIAKKAASQMATVAASLDRCGVPGRANQEALPDDQLEFGMGIHN
ncbi:hypothetical protein BFJ71_g16136 [Fusarium oxysporum]|nr:hypothetical protein BFJ71_g16136 [Fusarium oxysporum]